MKFLSNLFSLLYVSASFAASNEITIEELQSASSFTNESMAVLFYDENVSEWWSSISHPEVDTYTFNTNTTSNRLIARVENVFVIPTVKLYTHTVSNSIRSNDSKTVQDWIDLHMQPVARLDENNYVNYANNNPAVVVAQTESTCSKLQSESDYIKYACYLSQPPLVEDCDVAVFGKFMNSTCAGSIENVNETIKQHAFPKILDSSCMNNRLLHVLRPANQSIFVVSNIPPNMTNVSDSIHVIWGKLGTPLLPVSNPTAIRQHMWTWYGHEMKTPEMELNVVHDSLHIARPLNLSRFFSSLKYSNLSLYFDETWNGTAQVFPKRRKIKKFNFTKPEIPKLPDLNLSLEEDLKLAKQYGIQLDDKKPAPPAPAEPPAPKPPALQQWGDDFHEKRAGKATLAKFYAPWCGHCKRFAKPYEEIANVLQDDDVHVVKVDATKHKSVYKVRSIPLILYFPAEGEEQKYSGKRDVESLVKWTRKKLSESGGQINKNEL